MSSPRCDFLGKNHCPALRHPPILLSDGRFPARHMRRPKRHRRAMGQTASRAFFAPFLLSPHASRTPGILSLLQKPSPGAAPFPLRRSGWMTRHMRCASRGKRPPGGARVTGDAARSSRPPRSSWEEEPTEDRESVYTTLRVRIRGYARARLLQRERELSQNNLL